MEALNFQSIGKPGLFYANLTRACTRKRTCAQTPFCSTLLLAFGMISLKKSSASILDEIHEFFFVCVCDKFCTYILQAFEFLFLAMSYHVMPCHVTMNSINGGD